MDAGLTARLIEQFAQLGREKLGERTAQSRVAWDARQPLDLRVPALHAIVQIRRQYPDVDGLDDILAELLQPLVFLYLALQRAVQPRVLDRDADVAGQRSEQLHIVARKEVALVGPAERQIRDGPAPHAAREIVGEIQLGNRSTNRDRPLMRHRVQQMPRALEEQVGLAGLIAQLIAQKAEVQFLRLLLAALLPIAQRHVQLEPIVVARRFARQEKRHMLDGQRVQQPVRHRAQHLVQIRFRSQLARELDQRAPVVVAILIEEVTVQLFLQPIPNRLEDERRKQNQTHDCGRAEICPAA